MTQQQNQLIKAQQSTVNSARGQKFSIYTDLIFNLFLAYQLLSFLDDYFIASCFSSDWLNEERELFENFKNVLLMLSFFSD
jgi:hypothetical protein